jgi:class 3 adenylate cyclase
VEKVATVGDAFIGASFPPVMPDADAAAASLASIADANGGGRAADESPATRTARLVSALRFALAILEFASNGLQMRVGLHVGGAVCGCFGTTPPKIDLLGADFELAQVLEQTGTPGQVHASRAVLQAVKGQGDVIGASETEHGQCFTGWDVTEAAFDASGSPLPNAIDPETGNQIFTLAELDEEDQDAFLMGGAEALNPVGRLKRAIAESALQVCELLAEIADDGAQTSGHNHRRGHPGSDDASGSLKALDENELANLGLGDDDGDTEDDEDDEDDEQEMSEASARMPLVGEDMVSSIGHGSMEGASATYVGTDNGGQQADAVKREPYDFSVVLLEFYRKRDERRYLRTARRSPLIASACTVFAYLTTVLYIAHALLGCTESTQNRIVLGVMGGLLIAHFFYLSRAGTAHRYNSYVIYVHYGIVTALAIVGIRGDCDTHPQQELTSGNLLMLIYLMWSTAPQFLLNIPLKLRAVVIFVTAAIFCGLVAIRRAVIKDHAMEWDYLFGMEPIAILFVSYFADYSQRRAFQSRMTLRRMLKSEAGRHAEFASRALDVTLPRFVSERIVARLKAANADRADNSSAGSGDDASSSYAPSAVSGTDSAMTGNNNVGDAKAGLLKVSAELVWDFPHVAVMFISFGAVADPVARLHELICTVEDAVADLGVHKIKTVGTTVLCAAGMRSTHDDKKKKKHGRDGGGMSTGSPEEAVWSSVEAALAVAGRLGPDSAAAMRCGIHIGHLVGAVVGAEGLMFDVFGDTVNTASRVCTSCPPGSVRLSEPAALRLALLRDLDFAVAEEPTTVKVKGKGKMLVYDVNRLAPSARPADEEPFSFAPNRSSDPAIVTPPGGRSPTLRSPEARSPSHRSPHQALSSALRSPQLGPAHFEGDPMSPATAKRTRRVSIHRPAPVDTPAGEISSMDNSVAALSPTPADERR